MTIRKTTFEAIGTYWSVECRQAIAAGTWASLQKAVQERIAQFDHAYSRFRKDSLVSQMAMQAGEYSLPEDATALLGFYERLYHVTDGLVTPLIGQVMEDIGYDAEYSLKPKTHLQASPAWEDALEYNADTVTLKQPVLLDFGAAGKGYLVDLISRLMDGFGLQHYVINAAGDILHKGNSTERIVVGLENPFDTDQVLGTVELANASLCASAVSRRAWGGYHHIVNPKSLEPVSSIAATWAIAQDTMTADGIATALFFTSPTILEQDFTFAYAILSYDMSLEYSKDFPVTLFRQGDDEADR